MSTVVVTGLGRCGTTAVMRMLDAAGARVTGAAPDYEVDEAVKPTKAWFDEQEGRAVKILNPLQLPAFIFDPERTVVILLTRAAEEQALSQIKFVKHNGADARTDRASRRALTSQIRKETSDVVKLVRASGCPALHLSFERLITDRQITARVIAEFLRPLADLDDRRMWPEIWRRTSYCLPDMLEPELMKQAPYLHGSGH